MTAAASVDAAMASIADPQARLAAARNVAGMRSRSTATMSDVPALEARLAAARASYQATYGEPAESWKHPTEPFIASPRFWLRKWLLLLAAAVAPALIMVGLGMETGHAVFVSLCLLFPPLCLVLGVMGCLAAAARDNVHLDAPMGTYLVDESRWSAKQVDQCLAQEAVGALQGDLARARLTPDDRKREAIKAGLPASVASGSLVAVAPALADLVAAELLERGIQFAVESAGVRVAAGDRAAVVEAIRRVQVSS